jgi:thioester reductase-like protein
MSASSSYVGAYVCVRASISPTHEACHACTCCHVRTCVVLIKRCMGFIGAFLLAELFGSHLAPCAPCVQRLVCLVRAADGAAGQVQLRNTLTRYGLLEPGDAMDAALQSAAVTAVAGHVELPRLGLPGADWQRPAATLAEV